MAFLHDIDAFTFVFFLVTVLLWGFLLLRSATGQPSRVGRMHCIGLGLAIAYIFIAYEAYSPDADQAHLRIAGKTWSIHRYAYHRGKRAFTGNVVCVNDCSAGAPRLELSQRASQALNNGPANLSLVYLGRTEDADIGNRQFIAAHPVVEIYDLASGKQLYYKDTHRHWPRAIVFGIASLFSFVSFGICLQRARARQGTKQVTAPGSASLPVPVPEEKVGLRFAAKCDET
ncbi:MAG TPA: hypothetical protein VK716_18330 [Terracidiphilus sp.]|nr:hypothetical protein [Terracidiphilus sp.]